MREPYTLELHEAPESEPVTVAELKAHLRITADDEDDLLSGLIVAAREFVEISAGCQIVAATWDMSMDRFPCHAHPIQYAYGQIDLPRFPVSEVESITYYDTDGEVQTLSSDQYQVDGQARSPRICPAPLTVWPVTQIGRINAVVVRFVAGYETIPERLKVTIKLLAGHLYEHREATITGSLAEIPLGLRTLLRSCSSGGYC
jgi:uncharacterized phiE125 gp8 family phage protein